MKTPEWTPLFSNEEAQEVFAALETVQTAVADPGEPWIWHETGEALTKRRRSLSWGSAGRALWHAYAAASLGFTEELNRLETTLDELFDGPLPMHDCSLFGGATGIAWTMQHLTSEPGLGVDLADDPNDQLDPVLWQRLFQSANGTYDLVSGTVGLGTYALERLPDPSALRALKWIIADLDRRSVVLETSSTWYRPSNPVTTDQAVKKPQSQVDLGHAHGVAGILAFLCRVHAVGLATETVEHLLEGGVRWLIDHQLPEENVASFPPTFPQEDTVNPSRLAWCYGDLSASVALCMAGTRLGRSAWVDLGLGVARRTCGRPRELSGVEDCGLCHGAAGIAHIFNRLYWWSGDPVFGDAARSWFHALLHMGREESPTGSFFARVEDSQGRLVAHQDSGFLMGMAGVGLALAAAVSTVEPHWDRVLLLSPWDVKP